jgi:hypothetical protein
MKNENGKAPREEIATSFCISPELSDRLRFARALTKRTQKELVSTAITEYLERLGVPATLPKLREKASR